MKFLDFLLLLPLGLWLIFALRSVVKNGGSCGGCKGCDCSACKKTPPRH